jgi:hypothetical protein
MPLDEASAMVPEIHRSSKQTNPGREYYSRPCGVETKEAKEANTNSPFHPTRERPRISHPRGPLRLRRAATARIRENHPWARATRPANRVARAPPRIRWIAGPRLPGKRAVGRSSASLLCATKPRHSVPYDSLPKIRFTRNDRTPRVSSVGYRQGLSAADPPALAWSHPPGTSRL